MASDLHSRVATADGVAQTLLPASLAGPVWVVAPHPDDESLGCGGLLAELARLNIETWALLLTDGSASHPSSAQWPAARLAAHRLAEWHAGLDLLGLGRERRLALGLPDGALPLPEDAGGAQAAAAVRQAFEAAPPATVLLPWRRDPHPDHRTAHQLVVEALTAFPDARQLEYTVWLPERAAEGDRPELGEARAWQVPVGRQLAKKEAAIRTHRSQLGQLITDDPGGFVLPEAMVRRALTSYERLLEVRA